VEARLWFPLRRGGLSRHFEGKMFEIDPELKHIQATREQVVAIIESVNQPHVAIPGKAPQAAQAFVTGVRNKNATFSIYIYLYLAATQDCVVYTGPEPQFPLEGYRDQEAEALNFVESMGFMMENANFRNLAPPAQEELLARLPQFAPLADTIEATTEEEAGLEEQNQQLARLLGAF
jgi:hypothetical protein